MVVPVSLRQRIIAQNHDTIQACHTGKRATNSRIARCYWWRPRQRDIDRHIKACLPCAQRALYARPRVPLQTLPQADNPFDFVSCDILGPMPQTQQGNKYILSIIDHFSRYLIL